MVVQPNEPTVALGAQFTLALACRRSSLTQRVGGTRLPERRTPCTAPFATLAGASRRAVAVTLRRAYSMPAAPVTTPPANHAKRRIMRLAGAAGRPVTFRSPDRPP